MIFVSYRVDEFHHSTDTFQLLHTFGLRHCVHLPIGHAEKSDSANGNMLSFRHRKTRIADKKIPHMMRRSQIIDNR